MNPTFVNHYTTNHCIGNGHVFIFLTSGLSVSIFVVKRMIFQRFYFPFRDCDEDMSGMFVFGLDKDENRGTTNKISNIVL